MSKIFQAYNVKTDEWLGIPAGAKITPAVQFSLEELSGHPVSNDFLGMSLFKFLDMGGLPIRVVHPNGSTYIVKNKDKAEELGLMPSRKTKVAKPTKSKKSKTSKKSETNVSTDVQVDAEGFLIGSWNPA